MAMPRFDPVRVAFANRRDRVEAMDLLAGFDEPVLHARDGLPIVVVLDPDSARRVLIDGSDMTPCRRSTDESAPPNES